MPVLAEQNTFVSDFEQAERSLASTGPASLHRLREAAIQRFADLGFPSTDNEDWRFTPLASLAQTRFHQAEKAMADGETILKLTFHADSPRLVFINGRFAPEHSRIRTAARIVVTNLQDAFTHQLDKVEPHLAQYADYESQAFTALNSAFIRDGAFVYLLKNAVVDTPIFLVHVSTSRESAGVSHPRTLIVAEPNSQAKFVEAFIGVDQSEYFNNAVTELVASESANIEYVKLQRESRRAFHIHTLQLQLAKSSNVKSHNINSGGRLVRNDVNAVLHGEGCECTLNGLSIASDEQLMDNHTRIDHAKAHCASHELYKSILDGKAHGVFNGRIYVHPDAQKTDAKQTNQTLLLSENAVIDAMPQLEIFADDVKCTHGATVGRLDAESIFYLRSRGIDKDAARSLLTYAFANDIVGRIGIESMRDGLEKVLIAADEHR
jgi:Fe-S cluster assembly protein SufD